MSLTITKCENCGKRMLCSDKSDDNRIMLCSRKKCREARKVIENKKRR